jgi:hypothetical protein
LFVFRLRLILLSRVSFAMEWNSGFEASSLWMGIPKIKSYIVAQQSRIFIISIFWSQISDCLNIFVVSSMLYSFVLSL